MYDTGAPFSDRTPQRKAHLPVDAPLDVALVVSADALDEPESALLASALGARKFSARVVAWDDPSVDWSRVRVAVLRATWDYHLRVKEFLAWARRADKRTRLWNPYSLIRWNAHKTYLRDLESRGVAIIPTIWLSRGRQFDLTKLLDKGWSRAVAKPVVSASAYRTSLLRLDTLKHLVQAQFALDALTAEDEMMLQPYMPTVETSGERSLVFLDGAFSHAIRRAPALGSLADGHATPVSLPVAPDEEAFARSVLAAADISPLYARVDVLRDASGTLRLMELELIEPALWVHLAPGATERFAGAIARRLEESRHE